MSYGPSPGPAGPPVMPVNPGSPPTLPPGPAFPRRPRGTQLRLIFLGAALGFLFCCVGGLYDEISSALNPGTPSYLPEPVPDPDDPALPPLGEVLMTIGVTVLIGGFVAAGWVGRRAAIARGERVHQGRPQLSVVNVLIPWRASRLVFSPRDIYGTGNPLLSRLGLARSILGVMIIGAAVLANSPRHTVTVPEYVAAQGFSNLVVATAIMLVVSLLLIVGTAAGQRLAAARSLSRPLVTIGAALLVIIAFVVGAAQLDRGESWLDTRDYQPWHSVIDVAMLVGVVWALIFVLVSCVLVVRHVFNASDGHPLLTPLIVIPVAWLALVIPAVGPERYWFLRPFQELSPGVELPVPAGLLLVFAVGGAATVTGLAVWELVSLRSRGIRLTSGWR